MKVVGVLPETHGVNLPSETDTSEAVPRPEIAARRHSI